jgi:hypothetical protein
MFNGAFSFTNPISFTYCFDGEYFSCLMVRSAVITWELVSEMTAEAYWTEKSEAVDEAAKQWLALKAKLQILASIFEHNFTSELFGGKDCSGVQSEALTVSTHNSLSIVPPHKWEPFSRRETCKWHIFGMDGNLQSNELRGTISFQFLDSRSP